MNPKRANRKLCAILSADVKGYSRLMGEDEVATIKTLQNYQGAIAGIVQEHRGRVVDSPGDNILAEFASIVDAVDCAVVIQRELKVRNAELPENRRMEYRIGVNLGDVIEEEGRLYGDGVNITARIENLAEGGGICISGTAYDQVGKKLPLLYEYLGQHKVKNIDKPVRVYRIIPETESHGTMIGGRQTRQRLGIFLGLALLCLSAAIAVWWHFPWRWNSPVRKAIPIEKAPHILAGKASIVVLPFQNLSGDPEQEYFSDGITNDLITDLSRFRDLFVIASNTAFTYKGKAVRIKDLGRELGVRYVLEGSVQRVGERVRVNAQLIEAQTEHHLWAERYNRKLKDLLAVQDEIIKTIVVKLAIKIGETERTRALKKETGSLEAYDYKLRGMEFLLRRERAPNRQARRMFEKAIELDPRYASAYLGLSRTYLQEFYYGWTEFPDQVLQKAHDLAQKALSIDNSLAGAHAVLGEVYNRRQQDVLAVGELNRAIELNPNDTDSYSLLGMVMLYQGRADEAAHLLETSMRFDPHTTPGTSMNLGLAYYLKGSYEEAINLLQRGVARRADFVGTHIALAAAYAQAGRLEEASQEAATVLRLYPFFELDSYGTVFRRTEDRDAIIAGLRKAGLK